VALIGVKLGHLSVERDRRAFLGGLVDLCAQATDAERCTVYVVDRERRELRAEAAHRLGLELQLPFGRGLAGHVAATGETINVPDAYADPRFDSSVDQVSGYRTANILAVPVWDERGDAPVGVIQVLNKRGAAFERTDQMVLERIAAAVAPRLAELSRASSSR